MSITTDSFSKPTKATLYVKVGEDAPRPATDEDLAKFGYIKAEDFFNNSNPKVEEEPETETGFPFSLGENNPFSGLFALFGDLSATFLDSEKEEGLPRFKFPRPPSTTDDAYHAEQNDSAEPELPEELQRALSELLSRLAKRNDGDDESKPSK